MHYINCDLSSPVWGLARSSDNWPTVYATASGSGKLPTPATSAAFATAIQPQFRFPPPTWGESAIPYVLYGQPVSPLRIAPQPHELLFFCSLVTTPFGLKITGDIEMIEAWEMVFITAGLHSWETTVVSLG